MVLLGAYSALVCSLCRLIGHYLKLQGYGYIQCRFYIVKGDQLFKFIGKFRYLGMEDLPQEFSVENCSINVEFLENKTGEITAGAYLLSVVEIRNSVRQIGAGALLFVNKFGETIQQYIYLILILKMRMATCFLL